MKKFKQCLFIIAVICTLITIICFYFSGKNDIYILYIVGVASLSVVFSVLSFVATEKLKLKKSLLIIAIVCTVIMILCFYLSLEIDSYILKLVGTINLIIATCLFTTVVMDKIKQSKDRGI